MKFTLIFTIDLRWTRQRFRSDVGNPMTTKWPAWVTSWSNPPESCNDTLLLFFHFLIKFGSPRGREQARCSSVDRNDIGIMRDIEIYVQLIWKGGKVWNSTWGNMIWIWDVNGSVLFFFSKNKLWATCFYQKIVGERRNAEPYVKLRSAIISFA